MKKQRPVTISGAIRTRLDDIEQRMYEGVRQIDIVRDLADDGIIVSLKNFRQLLYRAKKARKTANEAKKDFPSSTTIEFDENNDKISNQKNIKIEEPQKQEQKKPTRMSLAEMNELFKNPIDLDKM